MSRKKNKKNKKEKSSHFFDDFHSVNDDNRYERLHPETKKSVWAVIFIGIAIILFLASFKSAGPFGNFTYAVFEKLFGLGFYLLPLIFLIVAGVFLASERRRIYAVTFLGAIIFVLAGLGLIDIVSPGHGGITGSTVGFLEIIFGYWAAIVIVVLALIISLIVVFNFKIKIPKKLKTEENKETLEEIEVEKVKEAISVSGGGNNEKVEDNMQKEETGQVEIKERIAQSIGLKQKKGALVGDLSVNYIAPPLDLLRSSVEKPTVGDLRASANIIKRTFESFGISVEMGEINIGPKVTRYTLKPAEGVKLARITVLNSDLALALAAHPIRIEAPIPGKSLVGIEVPNKVAAIVRLGSLMNYQDFYNTGPLSFILGRDVNGDPIFSDIEKMPHILIAGSTGSGKSITIHSLIVSLLYKNSPQTLKMILIDPKRVELSMYDGLPHLISPVITQPKKTINVFRWLIDEMDKRYETLLQAGSRDIQSYNKKNNGHLPYILVVIDELADLMANYGREIEGSIVRLAQMARATGIHLVVSTQRPSVEVITGLIKANITSRIALQVASQIDSRTIIDYAGAEKLLGGGDMLFISSELSKPKRIQGAYISEEEINKVSRFIKENNSALSANDNLSEENPLLFNNGDETSLNNIKQDFFEQYSDNFSESEEDELFEEAVEVVKAAQKASASLLQRRLKVGYARAARLLDIMENKGIIGPGEGAKPREVYIDKIK